MKNDILKIIRWVAATIVVSAIIIFGWRTIETTIHGHAEHHVVSDIIAIILSLSLMINAILITFVKAIKSRDIVVPRQQFYDILKEHDKLYHIVRSLKCNMQIQSNIIDTTIANEQGQETSTVKFNSIEEFAKYIKCFNDLNIQYIDKELNDDDNQNTEKEGKVE